MGVGLAVVGLAGYAFLALAGHTLSAADAAVLSSLYLLVNSIGPGLFNAMEQETSRATSAQLATGGDPRVVARRVGTVTLGLLGLVLLVLAVAAPLLIHAVLAGQWMLYLAVLVSVVTSAAVYLVRGLLGGMQRFGGYSATLLVEGAMRLLPCLAFAASGSPDSVVYALVFTVGSGFGALAGLPWLRRLPASTQAVSGPPVRALARATLLLAGSTLLTLLVTNIAPIVVTSRFSTDPATAAAFAATFVLVRLPVLVFAPVQAMLLPALTKAATNGDFALMRSRLRLAMFAVAGIGALGVLLAFTLGPWAVGFLFGAHVRPSALVVGLLAVSTVGVLIAQVVQPGLVALGRHRFATGSWLVGSVVLLVLLTLPGNPVTVAVLGQLIGCGLIAVSMIASLWRGLRRARLPLPFVSNRPESPRADAVLIVVPAWNESQSVAATVREIRAALPLAAVLVVDDGSTDETGSVAAAAGARVLTLPFNLGVGGAMRAGFRYAVRNGYRAAVQVDADGQHDPAGVPALLSALDSADLVIGSRFAEPGGYHVHGPRKWAMRLLAVVLSRLARTPLTDVTSGFKAVGGRALPLFAEHYPVEYLGDTVESLVIAVRGGCVIAEVPARMRPRRGGNPSHGPWKSGVYLFRACFALLLALVRRWDLTMPEPVVAQPAPQADPVG
jgi:O-antigen/teichoic acid export membrane protein